MWTSIDKWLKTATRLDSTKSFPLAKVGWTSVPLTLTPKASSLRGNSALCLYFFAPPRCPDPTNFRGRRSVVWYFLLTRGVPLQTNVLLTCGVPLQTILFSACRGLTEYAILYPSPRLTAPSRTFYHCALYTTAALARARGAENAV